MVTVPRGIIEPESVLAQNMLGTWAEKVKDKRVKDVLRMGGLRMST